MVDDIQKEALVAEENTLICQVTGEQKKASFQEAALQTIIRSLSGEYGFDIKDMARDFRLVGISINEKKKRLT
ncbi:MAG: hypothetical protein PVH61_37560 [Candidatus Aminicenantes bacterium]|jgi:type I restriction enzyme M protein